MARCPFREFFSARSLPNICLFGPSYFARALVLKNCLDRCGLKPARSKINSKKCRWNTSTLPNSYFGIISPRYGEKRWWCFCVCLLYRRGWQCFIQVLKIWSINLIFEILVHSPYLSALDFWLFLVWNIEFDDLDFFPSLNWIFASKSGTRTRKKIQFIKPN